ncbi:MAG: hypothetical protein Q8R12_04130 [bacterium]|nr:hypothetical protein [bacterium]
MGILWNIKHYVILQAIAVKLDTEEKKGTRALDELYQCLLEELKNENPFPNAGSLKATALEMIEEGFLDVERGFISLTFTGYMRLRSSPFMDFLRKEISKEVQEKLDKKNPLRVVQKS